MPLAASSFSRRPLYWALVLSLCLHGGALLVPGQPPRPAVPASPVLQARLAIPVPVPPTETVPEGAPEEAPLPPPKPAKPPRPAPRPRVPVSEKHEGQVADPSRRQWSVAERAEMRQFLAELASPPEVRPSLAERSLAMAGQVGSQLGRSAEDSLVSLERLPDSPPVEPFSLEMYVDGLLKRLNRSAAFVRNDPRSRGLRPAAVQVRVDPSGSLQNFRVLYAADQQLEIDFVRSVVTQAVPFSPFPADLRRSARSLALTICILPAGAGAGGGGFGFTRGSGGDC